MPPKKKRKPRARARAQGTTRPEQKTRSTAQPDVDPNEKRRERIQQRREEKARAEAAARRRSATRRVVRLIAFAGVIVFAFWFFVLRQQIPDAIAGNRVEHFDTFAQESRANQLHTTQEVTYESVPPVSGQHNPNPAGCGIYAQEIPAENMVHTLEHGAVGILYHPEQVQLPQIRSLERIVGAYESHVFAAPYTEQEDPVTVVAWAHLMRMDDIDGDAITEFIEAFRQGADAPEATQECPKSADDPFVVPTPTPTAVPTPTTTGGGGNPGGDGGNGGDDSGGDDQG